MSKENLKGMSRRSFIGMGAMAAAAAGVAGLAGCAPAANGNASATDAADTDPAAQGAGASDVHIHNVTAG